MPIKGWRIWYKIMNRTLLIDIFIKYLILHQNKYKERISFFVTMYDICSEIRCELRVNSFSPLVKVSFKVTFIFFGAFYAEKNRKKGVEKQKIKVALKSFFCVSNSRM